MVRRALDALDPDAGSILFIERRRQSRLGRAVRAGHLSKSFLSLDEGYDNPIKSRHMFAAAGW